MAKYRFSAKVWIKKNNRFLMSEGRMKLLKLIEKHGSIKRAAEDMKMSYRHAWGIIEKINSSLGVKVVESIRGGREGGRTVITSAGYELIKEYELHIKAVEVITKFGPRPAVTVDGIIIRDNKILLIKRANDPFMGKYALPGGFVEFKEPTETAVVREIEEETGLKTRISRLMGVYSAPDRDPRGHTISVIYELEVTGGKVKAGSDAAEFKWFDQDDLPDLAFDHNDIINDFKKIKNV